MKRQYDRDSSKDRFEKCDNVWLYTPRKKKGLSAKLQRFWHGPYTVIKRINDLVYKIQAGPRCKPTIVHRNRLRKYYGSDVQTWFTDPEHPLQESVEIYQRPDNRITGRQRKNGATEDDDTPNIPLRRSGRRRCPPDRLNIKR